VSGEHLVSRQPSGRDRRVVVDISGGVADVRLARPDKLNALDAELFRALAETSELLGGDRSLRAVVLSGQGRAFCAGLDISAFQRSPGSGDGVDLRAELGSRLPGRITNLAQQAVQGWADLPVPCIAAIHGVALGGGLQLALGADLRIVSPDAQLSVLEIRWGLVPDMTGTWVLPRLVGPDVAKELTWTGRMVGGEEAVRLGLATRLADDPLAAALDLAGVIAASSPSAIRAAKALLDRSAGSDRAGQYRAESDAMAGLLGSPDQAEAVGAFLDERPPVFADPG